MTWSWRRDADYGITGVKRKQDSKLSSVLSRLAIYRRVRIYCVDVL